MESVEARLEAQANIVANHKSILEEQMPDPADGQEKPHGLALLLRYAERTPSDVVDAMADAASAVYRRWWEDTYGDGYEPARMEPLPEA